MCTLFSCFSLHAVAAMFPIGMLAIKNVACCPGRARASGKLGKNSYCKTNEISFKLTYQACITVRLI